MPYDKPWKNYEDQLSQLERRGLIITDRTKALHFLERIGYYRLSGYWFPFRERSEICCPLEVANGKNINVVIQTASYWIISNQAQPFKMQSIYTSLIKNYVCWPWMPWSALKLG